MGLLTGTGILFCATSVLILLPAMLAWSEDHHERRKTAAQPLPPQLRRGASDAALHAPSALRPCWRACAITLAALRFALRVHLVRREHEDHAAPGQSRHRRGRGGGQDVRLRLRLHDPASLREFAGGGLDLAGRAAAGAQKLVAEGALRLQRRDVADPASQPAAGGPRVAGGRAPRRPGPRPHPRHLRAGGRRNRGCASNPSAGARPARAGGEPVGTRSASRTSASRSRRSSSSAGSSNRPITAGAAPSSSTLPATSGGARRLPKRCGWGGAWVPTSS